MTPLPAERLRWYARAFQAVRLSWRLFRDRRVPFWTKLIPLFALLYVVSPIDLFSEIAFPVVGYVDDATLFLLSLYLFVRLAPKSVVAEHLGGLNPPIPSHER
jgi:uncharacterized membrane protein YkvA (DUF1232 family)